MNIWTEQGNIGNYFTCICLHTKDINSLHLKSNETSLVINILYSVCSTRLALACSNTQRMRCTPALPAGVTAPQVILASQPLSLADIQMVLFISTVNLQYSIANKNIVKMAVFLSC